MGNYHPIKEIVGICAIGLIALLGGFKSGEHKGFEKGVQSERQRIASYLPIMSDDNLRRGADMIRISRDTEGAYKTNKFYATNNFWRAEMPQVQDFTTKCIDENLLFGSSGNGLENRGLYLLGVAKGYKDSADFVKSGEQITLRPQ